MNIEHINDKIFKIPEDPKCKADPRGLGVVFMEKMKKFKDNIAQIDGHTGEILTHGEVLLRSIRVAQNLQLHQITSDDIIVICSYNHMDCALPLFAGFFLGVRIAPLDPSLPKSDFKFLLNMVKPKYIFSDPECVDIIETVVNEQNLKSEIVVYGDTEKHIPFSKFLMSTGRETEFQAIPVKNELDTAIIFFSSGTTGYPKGVCANHYALQTHQEALMHAVDPSVILYFSTFYWISATMLLTISVLAGTTRVVVKKFDENIVMQIIEKYKVSYIFMAPFYCNVLATLYNATDFDTSKLNTVMIGGAKISEEQMKTVQKLFPYTNVSSTYGMTEIAGCLSFFHSQRDKDLIVKKIQSSGRPVPGITYKFVDIETEKVVGKNKPGEIRIKGKALMTGYYNNPKATADAFDSEGYLYTGDVGYYDEDYCLYVVNRIKELIKYRSWHLIPVELEAILLTHPAIKDAAVVGKPHEIDGEHLTACVVLKPETKVSVEDLMTYYNEKIGEFDRQKLRGGIYIVENICRTPSGKLKRTEIRDLIVKGLI